MFYFFTVLYFLSSPKILSCGQYLCNYTFYTIEGWVILRVRLGTGERYKSFPLPGIEPQLSGCPTCSLVPVLNELSQLLYNCISLSML